jgi:hypothetical protein
MIKKSLQIRGNVEKMKKKASEFIALNNVAGRGTCIDEKLQTRICVEASFYFLFCGLIGVHDSVRKTPAISSKEEFHGPLHAGDF